MPEDATHPSEIRQLLSVLTPDSIGPLALSCLLAAQGPDEEVRRQGSQAVRRFQDLVASFSLQSLEGIFLGRMERVAYAAAATMIEADQEAQGAIERAQHDYKEALLGATVKSQVYIATIKWLVRLLLLMGASLFLARLGLDVLAQQTERPHTHWLPYALAFSIPVLIGMGQSLWRVYTTTNLVYQRDLQIQAARRMRRSKQMAAIRYARAQAQLAWDDFVPPGTPVPTAEPTLELLQLLSAEEQQLLIVPPLNVLVARQVGAWLQGISNWHQQWRARRRAASAADQ